MRTYTPPSILLLAACSGFFACDGAPTPPAQDVGLFFPEFTVEGERIREVAVGSSSTYDIRIAWPTEDGRAPIEEVFEGELRARVEGLDECGASGRWVDEGVHYQIEITPTEPGRQCLISLALSYSNRASSGFSKTPVLDVRTLAGTLEQLLLPLPETTMVIGEVRPVHAMALGELQAGVPERLGIRWPVPAPIAWSSTDPAVVTVDDAGLLTAVGAGTAELVIQADGLEDRMEVTVDDRPPGPPPLGLMPLFDDAYRRQVERGSVSAGRTSALSRRNAFDVVGEHGGPSHLLQTQWGSWLRVHWTGSGYGTSRIGEYDLDFFINPSAWVDDEGTWVLGADLSLSRVVVRHQPAVGEPWQTLELPTGYRADDGETVRLVRLREPYHSTEGAVESGAGGLGGFTGEIRPVDGQRLVAWSTASTQRRPNPSGGSDYCPEILRVGQLGPEGVSEVVDIRQLFLLENLSQVPDCSRSNHGWELLELYDPARIALWRVLISRAEERVDWVRQAGEWAEEEPGFMRPIAVPDTDDGIATETFSITDATGTWTALAETPGTLLYRQRLTAEPEGAYIEQLGGAVKRVVLEDGVHWLVLAHVDFEERPLYTTTSHLYRLPEPDADPIDGRGVGTEPLGDAGVVGFHDGELVQVGYDDNRSMVHDQLPGIRDTAWIGPDGPREIHRLPDGGAKLWRPGLPDVVWDTDTVDHASVGPTGDLWFLDEQQDLYWLPYDETMPVLVTPAEAIGNAFLYARPSGVIAVTDAGSTYTWRWLSADGTVEQSVSTPDTGSIVDPTMRVQHDDRLQRNTATTVEFSSDGLTWTTQDLPGVRYDTSFGHHIRRRGDTLWLVGPEETAHRGYEVALRTSDDDGVTWTEPSFLYPRGPSVQKVCAMGIAPDASAIGLLLDTNDQPGANTAESSLLPLTDSPLVIRNCSTLLEVPLGP